MMTAFFHSFSSYSFDTDDLFLHSARSNFTHFLLHQSTSPVKTGQERSAISLQVLEAKMRDLQLFYYTRVIAKLPIETYQKATKAYEVMQQSCPYADASKSNHHPNGLCTFQNELKDVEWIAWNEYDSPKSVLIINECPDLARLSKPSGDNIDMKHRLIVLTENASTAKHCVADLLVLRVGDAFVPAETCVRICNVMWYIDKSVMVGQDTTLLMEELVTRLFEAEVAYAGPTLL